MTLRVVLDALLVEVQGYLAEPSLLAVCPLTHRQAAFDAHLRWFVPRVKARRDFLAREARMSWDILNEALDRMYEDHPHPFEGMLYAYTGVKVLNRLGKALWPHDRPEYACSETESDG